MLITGENGKEAMIALLAANTRCIGNATMLHGGRACLESIDGFIPEDAPGLLGLLRNDPLGHFMIAQLFLFGHAVFAPEDDVMEIASSATAMAAYENLIATVGSDWLEKMRKAYKDGVNAAVKDPANKKVKEKFNTLTSAENKAKEKAAEKAAEEKPEPPKKDKKSKLRTCDRCGEEKKKSSFKKFQMHKSLTDDAPDAAPWASKEVCGPCRETLKGIIKDAAESKKDREEKIKALTEVEETIAQKREMLSKKKDAYAVFIDSETGEPVEEAKEAAELLAKQIADMELDIQKLEADRAELMGELEPYRQGDNTEKVDSPNAKDSQTKVDKQEELNNASKAAATKLPRKAKKKGKKGRK